MPRLVMRHGVKGFGGQVGMVLETHGKKVESLFIESPDGGQPSANALLSSRNR